MGWDSGSLSILISEVDGVAGSGLSFESEVYFL
jgi:hypothetical protein